MRWEWWRIGERERDVEVVCAEAFQTPADGGGWLEDGHLFVLFLYDTST